MIDDDLCTFQVTQLVVWIYASLIFGKENRVGHFSDIVIEGSCTYQQTVCLDAVGDFCSQVTYGDGMLEGTRCYLTQIAEQSLVGV